MHYKFKTSERELPHSLQSLGIFLYKPLYPSYYRKIGRAAFKAKKIQKALVNSACIKLDKERRKLAKQKMSVFNIIERPKGLQVDKTY